MPHASLKINGATINSICLNFDIDYEVILIWLPQWNQLNTIYQLNTFSLCTFAFMIVSLYSHRMPKSLCREYIQDKYIIIVV